MQLSKIRAAAAGIRCAAHRPPAPHCGAHLPKGRTPAPGRGAHLPMGRTPAGAEAHR
ncbi:hypothetical protein [Streptomyces apricus]|uniref:hypothetical protein n=1 Tax=Streptomyces apricus TaxID=1828112 RepID=UPI00165FC4F1|nr:hypothetical protein [Streptomyces apricus]